MLYARPIKIGVHNLFLFVYSFLHRSLLRAHRIMLQFLQLIAPYKGSDALRLGGVEIPISSQNELID